MKKLLKHMRLIHLIFLILGGAVLLSAFPFKTEYNMIYVNVDATGIENADAGMTNARDQDQTLLFEYYETIGEDFNNYKVDVYKFEEKLNTVNYMILCFGILVLAGVALLFLFQNANRKIYYGSNVAISLLVTLGIAIFGIILMANLFSCMGVLNKNSEVFNTVAILENPEYRASAYQEAIKSGSANGARAALTPYFYLTGTTLAIYAVFTIFVIVYAVFVLILTFAKFKRTKERRQEILSKAVENND